MSTHSSMDQITRRAVARLCEGKDTEDIHRIYRKARALREHRAAMAFLSALRPPVQPSRNGVSIQAECAA